MSKNDINWDECLEIVGRYIAETLEKYDMSQRDAVILIDTFKWFAATYHYLVEAGEIPKNKQLKHDPEQFLNHVNELMENEEL